MGDGGIVRGCGVGNDADGVKQFGLIGLQLNQQVVAGFAGNFKAISKMGWTAPNGISRAIVRVVTTCHREPPTMSISMIGLDTAKSVFQVHAVDKNGKAQMRRKVQRDELIPTAALVDPVPLSVSD